MESGDFFMNKQEFISRLSEDLNMSKSEIDNVISKVVEVISEALSKGDEIALPGFGKFLVAHRAGRKGINPLT